jgi:predicted RNA-binding Zn-ribbon protein involved in translation (DUF1610 family)
MRGSALPGMVLLATSLTNLVLSQSFRRKVTAFPCPRCGESFLGNTLPWRRIGKRTVCQHCGIRFGTPKSACHGEFVRVDAGNPAVRVADPNAVDGAQEVDESIETEPEHEIAARRP